MALLGCMLVVQPAFASDLSEAVNDVTDNLFGGGKGQTVSDVSNNIMASMADLPGVLAAFSYLLGILLAIGALLKLKDHVDNPTQHHLKDAAVRLVVGGGLFALPFVLDVIANTIGFDIKGMGTDNNTASSVVGNILAYGGHFGAVIDNIVDSIDNVPGFLAAFAYLLGILFAIGALLKLKEYVDNPAGQTQLKDVAVRIVCGGMLLTLPAVFTVLTNTVSAGKSPADVIGGINKVTRMLSCGTDKLGDTISNLSGTGSGTTLGDMFCNVYLSLNNFHLAIGAFALIAAILFTISGVMKLREHADSPGQVSILEPVKRFLAAGGLFALPYMIDVAQTTITGGASMSMITSITNAFKTITSMLENIVKGLQDFNCELAELVGEEAGEGCAGEAGGGLADMLVRATSNFVEPLTFVVMLFAYLAGLIFIVVGISRLVKTSQDGAKGPAGMGTIMTFLTGGILLSMTYIMDAVSSSMFNMAGAGAGLSNVMSLSAPIEGALTDAESEHITKVVNAVFAFLAVVGWISFVRGWFIIKEHADGGQQASLMAGISHIVGGSIAVNMGPFVLAVQNTLGIAGLE